MERGEALGRLAAARVGRLATVDHEGVPHVVPFVFVLEGERLYWAVDRKPKRSRELKRLTNIRHNPVVEVVIDEYDEDWGRLWWVRARGTARILDEGPESGRGRSLLAEKYEQYRVAPPDGPVVAMDLERITGWRADAEPVEE